MSSKDDPFGSGGKTIIRHNPGRVQRPDLVRPAPAPDSVQSSPVESPDSTIIDPGAARHPPQDWASGTVIYQGTPFADMAMREGADQGDAGPAPRPASGPDRKIAQDAVLDARHDVDYSAVNPMIAAAAPLLMLLGHLRLITAETQAAPLAKHIAEAIQEFERKIAEAGIADEDARIAKFVLCDTADDIIRNLPGSSRDAWAQHSMLSRFFRVQSSGAGFFEALNKVLANPETHYDLLEFMHACLSLGFEGQYRGLAREDQSLERVRRDVYETLRYFKPRPDDEISPRWEGLSATMAQISARVPLWTVAAATLALVAGAFFTLRILITNEGDALADELLALTPPAQVVIERATFAPMAAEVKSVAQIDRIRAALAKDIGDGGLAVGTKGDFIVVEINNLLLFQSGKANVKPEFEPVAGNIAAALEPEPGPITIVGHTDNVKPGKSGTFKSNFDLSVARAKAVEKVVASKIGDPSRIAVEGKGEDEPIADNGTPEGRAKNRRVDLMIPREETL